MNILVTGGTGFIGRYLLKKFLKDGHYCRCLARNEECIASLPYKEQLETVQGDVTDPDSLKGIGDGIDVVYHLSAVGDVSAVNSKSYSYFHSINVLGAKNVFNACSESGIRRFVHFSSTSAMGLIKTSKIDESMTCKPVTPYQRSKYESELAVLELGEKTETEVIIIRPCMTYGPGSNGEFLKFCRLIKKGLFPRIGLRKNLTPIVHVEDLIQAAANALNADTRNQIFVIASEDSPPLAEIQKHIKQALNIKRPYFYVPVWVALLAAHILEKIAELSGGSPIVSKTNIKSVATGRVFDISKAKKELNYKPNINLAEGIKETVEWYKKNHCI